MDVDYWKKKTCVVTGASSGLGWAIAEALVARGARVALVARQREPLEAAVSRLSASPDQALPVPGDVTWDEDVERIATVVHEHWGPADVLCNCAGRSMRGEILDATAEDFRQLMDVNFLGAVRMTRAFAGDLLERRGFLINVGSLASRVAPRFLGAYPAGKFALAAYTQQLRLELGPRGLHTLLVCPGPLQRDDAAPEGRYAEQAQGLPAAAHQPGGGAKVDAIDPRWLARKIVAACQQGKAELIVPGRARWLFILSQISPRLGDWVLRKSTSG